jgi:hypothetical protein
MFTPPLHLLSAEDERRYARDVQQQLVAEAGERHVEYEHSYWPEQRADRRAAREAKRVTKDFSNEQYRFMELGMPTIPDNDDRWLNTFMTNEEDTNND